MAESHVRSDGLHNAVYIFATLRCPLECEHCAVTSHSRRREEIPTSLLEEAAQSIADSKKVNCVVFTGGEPFLVLPKLRNVMPVLSKNHISTALQTSAYWAYDFERAFEQLATLPGLNQLIISADEFHQQFVPFGNVVNACNACIHLGISIRIQTLVYESEVIEDKLRAALGPGMNQVSVVSNSSVHLTGRGKRLLYHPELKYKESLPNGVCFHCSAAFMLPDGTVTACGSDLLWNQIKGSELFRLGKLGDASFLDISNSAERHYLVQSMRVWGPAKLAELARQSGCEKLLRSKYIQNNVCDLCCDLFSKDEVIKVLLKELGKSQLQREIDLLRALFFGEWSNL